MPLSKNTSKVLKTGVAVAGTVAAFTPVGGLVGLTGAAAVAADVVGGTVISGVADKLSHKANQTIDKNTAKTAKKSASKSATSKSAKSSSSTDNKVAGAATTGVAGMGLTHMLGNNSNGRSTAGTTDKFSGDLQKIQTDSTKNYQRDLARVGVAPSLGDASQQASMS